MAWHASRWMTGWSGCAACIAGTGLWKYTCSGLWSMRVACTWPTWHIQLALIVLYGTVLECTEQNRTELELPNPSRRLGLDSMHVITKRMDAVPFSLTMPCPCTNDCTLVTKQCHRHLLLVSFTIQTRSTYLFIQRVQKRHLRSLSTHLPA